MKTRKLPILILILFIAINLTGCTFMDNINVKLGFTNVDFDYMNQNKVNNVVIQSTRDTGFRFVVTDQNTIKDIYKILSSAKKADKKTDLEPDYVLEIHQGDEIKTFKYVTGVNDSSDGNFYDDENIYRISKRLDNDIIQNLSFIRKPREFESVYYDSILKTLEKEKDILNVDDSKVGIDILGDNECTKYMLSIEIEDFMRKAKKIVPNFEIINNNRENFDIIFTVRNYGYSSKVFKTIITIDNKLDKSQEKIYVDCKYENGWKYNLFDEMPKEWK